MVAWLLGLNCYMKLVIRQREKKMLPIASIWKMEQSTNNSIKKKNKITKKNMPKAKIL